MTSSVVTGGWLLEELERLGSDHDTCSWSCVFMPAACAGCVEESFIIYELKKVVEVRAAECVQSHSHTISTST